MLKLPIKDLKILQELDFEARQPISRLAKKVGLSPEVTAYRIKQLERKGIITGYYPVINLSMAGYMFCRITLQLEKITPRTEQELLEYARTNTKVGWIIFADNWRVGFVVYAKDIYEAKEHADEIISHFNSIIRKKSLSIATKIYHFKRKYIYQAYDYTQLVWGERGKIDLDQKDTTIIRALTQNARLPATEIAPKVGLSSVSVINRIKALERARFILGYRCALNLEKLGYTHLKIFLYIDNLTVNRKSSFIEFIRRWPYSVYITEAFGKSDLEFEGHVPNIYTLDDFMRTVREKYPEVKSYESLVMYKEIILRYFPETGVTYNRKPK